MIAEYLLGRKKNLFDIQKNLGKISCSELIIAITVLHSELIGEVLC